MSADCTDSVQELVIFSPPYLSHNPLWTAIVMINFWGYIYWNILQLYTQKHMLKSYSKKSFVVYQKNFNIKCRHKLSVSVLGLLVFI
jgi:hypothetical protein